MNTGSQSGGVSCGGGAGGALALSLLAISHNTQKMMTAIKKAPMIAACGF
jgi:hypothetical protein